MSREGKTWPASDKAAQFVKDTIVIEFFAPPHGVGWVEDEELHEYLDRAKATGITGTSMTLAAVDDTWEKFVAAHQKWCSTFYQQPEKYVLIHSVRDIKYAHETGKTAVIYNAQTSTPLNGDLNKVGTMRHMGIATMQLVYNGRFRAGVGCLEPLHTVDTGLTDWGRSVIDEMVTQGIVVDLSHASLKTTDDIIVHMKEHHPGVPVIYSHSIPAGLYEELGTATESGCYRNINDDQIKKAAKIGGLVAPTFTEWMVDGIWPDDITPLQCAQMVDYVARLVGVDHVGIATDDMMRLDLVIKFAHAYPDLYADNNYMLDAFSKGADGCGEAAKILPAVTDELWKMDYSNEDIAKMYGGNMLRVYEQVWK